MLKRNRQISFWQALGLVLSLPVAAIVAVPTSSGAEPLTLEAVKARLEQQHEKIDSLYLRVRRETTLWDDPQDVTRWTSGRAPPEYQGTDEVLIAFKGDKRYSRRLELDYKPPPLAGSGPEAAKDTRRYLDEAKAWTGEVVLERNRDLQSGKFVYRTASGEQARDGFPPSPYLTNVGLAVADPTGREDAGRIFQQMHLLPELLRRWPYKVMEKPEVVEGTPCVVLVGKMQCEPLAGKGPQKRSIVDKLCLDPEHGLAIRKRETLIDGRLIRLLSSHFQEVLPDVWLPKRSRTEVFTRIGGIVDLPAMTREMKLCFWLVNRVPDDLFDVVLTKPSSPSLGSAFDRAPAFHWRRIIYYHHGRGIREGRSITEIEDPRRIGHVEEGWAVRGVGRRVEVRKGSELLFLCVETPRWRLVWNVQAKRVDATPSQLDDPSVGRDNSMTRDRESQIRAVERPSGIFVSETERLDAKEVEKITPYLPTERRRHTGGHIRDFEPKKHLERSGTEFQACRTRWFDLETRLTVQSQCGCQLPNRDEYVDYPPPESVPRELFTFQVPRDALLAIGDPELGRHIYSEGQTEPDLRE
ncbi:MAG: hypothetical protein ACYTG0_22505 [Planctomycetota bacterium]|jgi:hypothetical protein